MPDTHVGGLSIRRRLPFIIISSNARAFICLNRRDRRLIMSSRNRVINSLFSHSIGRIVGIISLACVSIWILTKKVPIKVEVLSELP